MRPCVLVQLTGIIQEQVDGQPNLQQTLQVFWQWRFILVSFIVFLEIF